MSVKQQQRRSITIYKPEMVESLLNTLKEHTNIAPSPREGKPLTARRVIAEAYNTIAELLERGYTLNSIHGMFIEKGLDVSYGSFKSYVSAARVSLRDSSVTTKKRSRRVVAGTSSNASAVSTPAVVKTEVAQEI